MKKILHVAVRDFLATVTTKGFILALVGEYLGRIQREVEGRPLYTIEKEL